MKKRNLIVTALVAATLAAAPASAFAAKKEKKNKEGKTITLSTKQGFILHRKRGADTNAGLTKGRGVGFNGGFYGHSGGT
ncbi:MAG: hypothetical protein AAGF54_20020 [Pseudomonadota bacterium]